MPQMERLTSPLSRSRNEFDPQIFWMILRKVPILRLIRSCSGYLRRTLLERYEWLGALSLMMKDRPFKVRLKHGRGRGVDITREPEEVRAQSDQTCSYHRDQTNVPSCSPEY